MKILILIPTLSGGGAEKVLSDLVSHLNKTKYKITVKTIFNEGLYIDSVKKFVKYEYVFNTANSVGLKSKLMHILVKYFKWLPSTLLWTLLIHKKYDVEVAFMEGICTKIISGSFNRFSKKIAWVHTDLIKNTESDRQYASYNDARKSYNKFNKIVCVSDASKESFEKKFKIDALVQNNLVDEKMIMKMSKEPVDEYELYKEEITIISVGRLTHIKGYHRLVNIHSRLIKNGYIHKLIIVGDGPEKVNLEKIIVEKDLSNSVKLIGFRNNPYKYIASSDLYVSSSFAEGYPLVLAEAFVLGIPIIATRTAGSTELLNNGEFGLLVDNDEDSLYEGIRNILNSREKYNNLRMQSKNRANDFKLEKKIVEFERLLDS